MFCVALLLLAGRFVLPVICLVIAAAVAVLDPGFVYAYILRGQPLDVLLNLNNRLEPWYISLGLFQESPLIGQGYYSGIREKLPVLLQHHASGDWVAFQAHNDIINALVNTGLIGTALIFGFVFAVFARALTVGRSIWFAGSDQQARFSADAATIILVLLTVLVNGVFHSLIGWDATYGFAFLLLTAFWVHFVRRDMQSVSARAGPARGVAAGAP